ncbi:metallophosphoesterase [Coprothermobacter platensis]|uniref:metallophosphoesterase n=1 Tax=Coprothermobacter platensis TaxID=108819 RepID=UPI001FDFA976|nr:metallophosphoesterase [Coprothermobacter platensis]
MLTFVLVVTIGALLVVSLWEGLTVRPYTLSTGKISTKLTIAILSDLHSTVYGENQSVLLKKVKEQKPDLVLLAGDIVDDRRPAEGAIALLKSIATAYPCFYVTGNHEFWSGRADEIKESIRSLGITVLEGRCTDITLKGQQLQICGVDDPDGFTHERFYGEEISARWDEQFERCKKELKKNVFSILLSHRPERVAYYKGSGFDLVVSGHAHGGQIRIPGLIDGLYAPDQGLLPKYTGGVYDLRGTRMVVSRGLSRSFIPRVFNPPELVIMNIEPLQ